MQYEVTVLAKDELELGSLLKKFGAKVTKEGTPEKKTLSYPIQKLTTGVYHFAIIEIEGGKVVELEKKLLADERVLRTLIVKN